MFRKPAPRITPTALVVGLGNPGPTYARTRHNVGFQVVERLAARHRLKLNERRFRARFGVGSVGSIPVCIAMPMTYMNLSGEAAVALLRHYNLKPERLLVALDDLALECGRLRIRPGGSSGGHNGLKSIERSIQTQDYPRLRIGIGSAYSGETIDYVLGTFKPGERADIEAALERAVDAVEMWLTEPIDAVMGRFNRAEPEPTPEGQ